MRVGERDFVTGVDRVRPGKAHLYLGDFDDPGDPMCKRGWTRGEHGYSIFRNQMGVKVCRVCERRALAGLPAIPFPLAATPTGEQNG